jgi:hypothetical protein
MDFPMETDGPVREIVMGLVTAWNSRDANAFGTLFTSDAVYVGTNGVPHKGTVAIEGLLAGPRPHFQVFIEGQMSILVDDERAKAAFRWKSHEVTGIRGIIRCELVKHGQNWRIGALHNTVDDSDQRSPG